MKKRSDDACFYCSCGRRRRNSPGSNSKMHNAGDGIVAVQWHLLLEISAGTISHPIIHATPLPVFRQRWVLAFISVRCPVVYCACRSFLSANPFVDRHELSETASYLGKADHRLEQRLLPVCLSVQVSRCTAASQPATI